MTTVHYLLVDCMNGKRRVARAAISSTWAGVVLEGDTEIEDVTDLLDIRNRTDRGLLERQIDRLDREIETFADPDAGEALTRANAEHVVKVLEEAVPEARTFRKVFCGSVNRLTTVGRPVRARLNLWIATGNP